VVRDVIDVAVKCMCQHKEEVELQAHGISLLHSLVSEGDEMISNSIIRVGGFGAVGHALGFLTDDAVSFVFAIRCRLLN
jgi:hypothetical protein